MGMGEREGKKRRGGAKKQSLGATFLEWKAEEGGLARWMIAWPVRGGGKGKTVAEGGKAESGVVGPDSQSPSHPVQ